LNGPVHSLADCPPVEILLPTIEQIALRIMRQNECPRKRRLDNYKAVEWAIAAKGTISRHWGFPSRPTGSGW